MTIIELSDLIQQNKYAEFPPALEQYLSIPGHSVTDLESQSGHSSLLIQAASQLYNSQALRSLVKKGLKVDVQDKNDHTALMIAASCCNRAGVEVLLDNNAKLDIQDQEGNTALHHAAMRPCVQYPEMLPMYWKEREKIIHLLLLKGARIDIKNNQGLTAIELVDKSLISKSLIKHFMTKGETLPLTHMSQISVKTGMLSELEKQDCFIPITMYSDEMVKEIRSGKIPQYLARTKGFCGLENEMRLYTVVYDHNRKIQARENAYQLGYQTPLGVPEFNIIGGYLGSKWGENTLEFNAGQSLPKEMSSSNPPFTQLISLDQINQIKKRNSNITDDSLFSISEKQGLMIPIQMYSDEIIQDMRFFLERISENSCMDQAYWKDKISISEGCGSFSIQDLCLYIRAYDHNQKIKAMQSNKLGYVVFDETDSFTFINACMFTTPKLLSFRPLVFYHVQEELSLEGEKREVVTKLRSAKVG